MVKYYGSVLDQRDRRGMVPVRFGMVKDEEGNVCSSAAFPLLILL